MPPTPATAPAPAYTPAPASAPGPAPAPSFPTALAPTPTAFAPTTVRPEFDAIRCPTCATSNLRTRRFCSKCGTFIGAPSAPLPAAATRRLPWWRRWLRRRSPAERRARRAYRRSLPLWIRLRRWLVALAVIALAWAYLAFIGRDPVGWAKQRLYAIRGTVEAVPDVRASTYPVAADRTGALAAKAVDGDPATTWSTPFDGKPTAGTACEAGPGRTSLVLTAKRPFTARAITIQAPPADQIRLANWRPTQLGLLFDDGTCKTVDLRDTGAVQQIKFPAKKTLSIAITVVGALPPEGGSRSNQALIGEAHPMQRPPS